MTDASGYADRDSGGSLGGRRSSASVGSGSVSPSLAASVGGGSTPASLHTGSPFTRVDLLGSARSSIFSPSAGSSATGGTSGTLSTTVPSPSRPATDTSSVHSGRSSSPQRHTEALLPLTRHSYPLPESAASLGLSPRRHTVVAGVYAHGLQEASVGISAADPAATGAGIQPLDRVRLSDSASLPSVGDASTRQSTGEPSPARSIGEASTRQSTAHGSPRAAHAESHQGYGTPGSLYSLTHAQAPPELASGRASTSFRMSQSSATGGHAPSPGAPASARASVETIRDLSSPAGRALIEAARSSVPAAVTAAPAAFAAPDADADDVICIASDDGADLPATVNPPLPSEGPNDEGEFVIDDDEDEEVTHAAAVVGDGGAHVNADVEDEEEEEEGDIFLITEDFDPRAEDVVEEVVEEVAEDRLHTGRESLDFTFSHSDSPAIPQQAGALPGAMDAVLYARENFSFSGLGAHSPESHIHGGAGDHLPGTPMVVDELRSPALESRLAASDSSGRSKGETLSFSERVYKFVAGLRSGGAADSPAKAGTHAYSAPRVGPTETLSGDSSCVTLSNGSGRTSGASPLGGARLSERPLPTHTPVNAVHTVVTPRFTGGVDAPVSHVHPSHHHHHQLIEEAKRSAELMSQLHPVDPSSYINSSSSCSSGILTTPKDGSSAKLAFASPALTNSTCIAPDYEPLHTKGLYASLVRDASHRHDELLSPYDDVYSAARGGHHVTGVPPKRTKLTGGGDDFGAAADAHAPEWMSAGDMPAGDAAKLVQATFHSIKVLIGAKLCGAGYGGGVAGAAPGGGPAAKADFQSLSTSLFNTSATQRQVYEDTKSLVGEMIENLKRINALKARLRISCAAASEHAGTLDNSREAYCSLVRSCRRMSRAISETDAFAVVQRKLLIVKVEKLNFLRGKLARLVRRNQLYMAVTPKVEHLERALSALSNAYTATGIKVVPLSTGGHHMRWCLAVSFNSELNTKRCVRKFRRTWQNELVRLSDRAVEELLRRPFEYHRVKLDQRFNTEVNMLVYLRSTSGWLGPGGIYSSCTRSVMRFYDDSPADDRAGATTSTPRDRAHVAAFRSLESVSSGPASAKAPVVASHVVCNSSGGVHSALPGGAPLGLPGALPGGSEVAVAFDLEEDGAAESPRPAAPVDVSLCETSWDEDIEVEDIRHGLRVVFTSPRVRAGGELAKVWEQALFRLLEAANSRIDQMIQRLVVDKRTDQRSMTLFALVREVMDYGSALSARIRVVQRELLELLERSTGAALSSAEEAMSLRVVLTPQDATKCCLECAFTVAPYDLLQRGSYARACRDLRVAALQPGHDQLARALNAALAGADRRGSIYGLVAAACADHDHPLYG